MAKERENTKLPALIAGIKIEPGLPGRLPSFGGRRDLTLGSVGGPSKLNHNSETKPRRVYTPNLNVTRNKNKGDNIKEEHPNSKEKRERHKKDDFKNKRKDKTSNLIQSGGVFSEGIAGKSKKTGGWGGGGGGGGGGERETDYMPKPKLQIDRKIDRAEEEMKLKELLRDDFVDDPSSVPDSRNAPTTLPVLSLAKIKSEIKTEPKEEPKPKCLEVNGVKIKQEILDEEELETQPKLENGLATEEDKTQRISPPDEITISELLHCKEPELMFLQMPDCLPGLRPEIETGPARPSVSAKSSSSDSTPQNAEAPKYCTLGSLSDGCIGKLQILKSGKTRLVMGDVVLNLDMGTQVGFRQDLVAVELDQATKGGDMINLGPVKYRLVCSPDWESMLSKPVL